MIKFIGRLSLVAGIIVAIVTFGFLILQLAPAGGKGDTMMTIVYVLVFVPVLAGVVIATKLIGFGLKTSGAKPSDEAEAPDKLPDLKTLGPGYRGHRFF